MINRYAHVTSHTHTWLAEQRDFMHDLEMRVAILKDSAEPETDKAWRGVLKAHEIVRYQIGLVRRAKFDMGVHLTTRGQSQIEGHMRAGLRWIDPHPEITFVTAIKDLLGNLALLRERWAALREAENNQRRTEHAE